MNCEVHIATCGLKTECEHRYHLEDDESKVSAYTANQELNRSIMVTIVSNGGNLFSGSEELLSSFLMASYIIHRFLHTHTHTMSMVSMQHWNIVQNHRLTYNGVYSSPPRVK